MSTTPTAGKQSSDGDSCQLSTESKIFCACSTRFGNEPNENTCPVCLGLPGALPVLNRRVVELGARAALSLGLHINNESIFSRKNYFYPDLPKGYQISQYDKPFSANGSLEIMTAERDEAGHPIEWRPKQIAITRLHLEEDAGKNVHEACRSRSLFIYRPQSSGTPLAEIVTDPDFRTSWEAYDYVNHVRRTLQWVGASEADMEKGNLRCEPTSRCAGSVTRSLARRSNEEPEFSAICSAPSSLKLTDIGVLESGVNCNRRRDGGMNARLDARDAFKIGSARLPLVSQTDLPR